MPPAAELIDATKKYGEIEALRGVTIRIELGDVVAILGPNGAGKTTSISLLVGLRKPTSGKALLFGLEPTNLLVRSRVGVMLQESGVPAMLKVREIVDLFRSYYPKPLPRDRAIAMAGLEEKANALVKELSGGQRQRLYFALAVCGDPDVLFLDEPTVGMDVEGRRSFIERIAEFARMGRTVVLTTHYLEEADQLAKRVIVIDRGVVIADAPPAEIKSKVAGRRMRFVAPDLTERDLEGLPVTAVSITDHRVQLLTNRPEAVLRDLFQRGVDISDLEVAGADLEDAFIAMTSH
ncbi:MAG TPA: multidrug ABC transporter ATP-binding protein [Chloroflexi bacterium]|jgi:ABC-2 type transport system ATP-binding protein|nr:multidrug ABC transporter ATP-binding protein [Chloroflexota bacterium]HAF20738.1 multidrug ABC transporter ATP-binding protein [Chloroflexota bacterium]